MTAAWLPTGTRGEERVIIDASVDRERSGDGVHVSVGLELLVHPDGSLRGDQWLNACQARRAGRNLGARRCAVAARSDLPDTGEGDVVAEEGGYGHEDVRLALQVGGQPHRHQRVAAEVEEAYVVGTVTQVTDPDRLESIVTHSWTPLPPRPHPLRLRPRGVAAGIGRRRAQGRPLSRRARP